MPNVIEIDTHLVQILTWILTFLIVSFVSIIIWLARIMNTKMDTIVSKQDVVGADVSTIKNQVLTVTKDVAEIYEKLEDVQKISKSLAVVDEIILGVREDLILLKREQIDVAKGLGDLQKTALVNAEWIRMTEKYGKRST